MEDKNHHTSLDTMATNMLTIGYLPFKCWKSSGTSMIISGQQRGCKVKLSHHRYSIRYYLAYFILP